MDISGDTTALRLLAEWALVVLTVALVATTMWYAWQTNRLVNLTREALNEERERWKRDKSERAAYKCLDALRPILDRMLQDGPVAVPVSEVSSLQSELRGEGPLTSMFRASG